MPVAGLVGDLSLLSRCLSLSDISGDTLLIALTALASAYKEKYFAYPRFPVLRHFGPIFVHSGSILGPFWVHLGSGLGSGSELGLGLGLSWVYTRALVPPGFFFFS